MRESNKALREDYNRYNGSLSHYLRKFHYYFRKAQSCKFGLLKKYYIFRFETIKKKRFIEISTESIIGGGLYIGHPYCITINPKVKVGKNVNIHRGVMIGQENRGKRVGVPTIGNNVWIGINAVIVGNVLIGDNVLIAPNCFVNCDVPSNSIVFGNPCTIKHRDEATKHYINNEVPL